MTADPRPEASRDPIEAIRAAIRPLDSGALHCRYCPASMATGWEHEPYCAYEASVKAVEVANAAIDQVRQQLAEAEQARDANAVSMSIWLDDRNAWLRKAEAAEAKVAEAAGCDGNCACAIGSRHFWHRGFCEEREKQRLFWQIEFRKVKARAEAAEATLAAMTTERDEAHEAFKEMHDAACEWERKLTEAEATLAEAEKRLKEAEEKIAELQLSLDLALDQSMEE